MHRRVTSRRPAIAHSDVGAVVDVADINLTADNALPRQLSVAPEAKIGVRLNQQLGIDRAVRAVANRATFAECRVLEHKWFRLFPVTLGAVLVDSSHRQSTGGFHNIHPVRIVTLDTIHLLLEHRMMLGQMKLHLRRAVAFETRGGILTGIKDELPRTASRNMETARAMTGFATGLPCPALRFEMNSRVSAGWKDTCDFGMALGAGLVANERRAGNFGRRLNRARHSGTRIDQDGSRGDACKRKKSNDWVAGCQGPVISDR